MSINLLKMLQDQMGSSVVDQASKFLGESSANTSSGIAALLPSLLGGVIGKASTESGASGLLDMITKGNHHGGIMDSMGSMFSGGSSTSNLMNAGSLLTSSLFGGSKLGSVLDVVTSVTGMRRSSSSSLMNLLAPVVMGMIGKQVKTGGLNASGLMNMLMGQKEHIASALPAGMGSILGFSSPTEKVTDAVSSAASTVASSATNMASTARETVKEATSVTADVASTGGSWIRWALPLVALVAIGGFLWNYMGGATSKVADATTTMTDGAKNMAGNAANAATKTIDATGNAVAGAAGSMKDAAGNMVDGAKGMAGDAANKAGNMVDGAKGMAGDAANKAGNMVDGAKGMAGDAANKAGKMVDGAKGMAGDAANKAGKMIDGAKNTAGKMVDGKMADGMKKPGGNLGGKIKNAADKTMDAAGNAANATGGALSAAGMAAKEKFAGMFKTGSSASAYTLSDITFDPSGNKITNYSKDEVMALASALKADPNAKIQVQAFGKNKAIATGRAKLIQQILTTLGVNASQLSTKGMTDGADNNNIQVVVK